MITCRIQIENDSILDTFSGWGFIYKVGTRRFAPPEKKRDKSSYAEKAGANEDTRTVDDEFDYKVKFLIQTPNRNLENANSKIRAWNEAVREKIAGSHIKRCKTITLYDDYKRCKIVGIPEIIEEVDESDYFRRQRGDVMDCVVVELTIHVSDPTLCDFDMAVNETPDKKFPIDIALSVVDGELHLKTSRALEEGEYPTTLTRGVKRNSYPKGIHGYIRYRSKNRWHVADPIHSHAVPLVKMLSSGLLLKYTKMKEGYGYEPLISWITSRSEDDGYGNLHVWRATNCYYKLTDTRPECVLTYGIAIYSPRINTGGYPVRRSNVVYFRIRYKLDGSYEVEV